MYRFSFETDDVQLAQRILALFPVPDGPLPIGSEPHIYAAFVDSLTSACQQFVILVASASRMGKEMLRSDLRQKILVNGQPIGSEDDKLKGVTGSVGVAWHKAFLAQPNPFLGRPTGHRGDVAYRIPQDLAERIINEYARHEERREDHQDLPLPGDSSAHEA